MRYHFLFSIPYILTVALVIFSGYVLQGEQARMKLVTKNQCRAEREMYATITAGLRRRAAVELAIKLPPIEDGAAQRRSDALLLEAKQMEEAASLLPNCRTP